MAVNRGKQFEGQVQEAFEKFKNISIDRMPDPMAGYKGVKNICDFQVYRRPLLYYIECKTTYENTLNFKSNITKTQWEGLLEKSLISGVIAGILVWYIKKDFTTFVPIQWLEELRRDGAKSLHYTVAKEIGFELSGKKKRVLFEYDVIPFLDTLQRMYAGGYLDGKREHSCIK